MKLGFRYAQLALCLGCCLTLPACGERTNPPLVASPTRTRPAEPVTPPRDEIPPDQLPAVIDAHYRGLGAMERYEYAEAARAFGDVHTRAPGWTIGTVNLAIALLNQGGEAEVKANSSGDAGLKVGSALNIEAAQRMFDEILRDQPNQIHALFSRGVILRSQGNLGAAHRDFAQVVQLDPLDAHSWLEYGSTLTDPDREETPAGRKQASQLVGIYSKVLELNPYLVTAMFKLQFAHNLAGNREQQAKTYAKFLKMDPRKTPTGPGDVADTVYGLMGKYATIINPFPRLISTVVAPPTPRFGPLEAMDVALPSGDRWATAEDLRDRYAVIGRARERFGAGIASFDVNRDGRLDVYLTAAVMAPQGLRDALLVNLGDGHFADRTAAYGLPLDRAGLGVAAGDFDADLNVDLYLTGVANNRLFRQENSRFQDVTQVAGVNVPDAISLTARWFDMDQDGDLDLYVVNHASASATASAFLNSKDGVGLANGVFRNDGKPEAVDSRVASNLAPLATATPDFPVTKGLSIGFSTAWPALDPLQAGPGRHTAFAALDIDDDRDFDFVVTADGRPPIVLLNDREGRFRASTLGGWGAEGSVSGLLATDCDKDGRTDLVATCPDGRVFAWRNDTKRTGSQTEITGQPFPADIRHWRAAVTADLDLDTWSDLVGLPRSEPNRSVEWARNGGTRLENRPMAFNPAVDADLPIAGFSLSQLVGDALPDLMIWRDGEPPRIALNRGNGLHWLAVDLAGRWRFIIETLRTNSEGLGTRLSLEGRGLYVPVDYASPEAGTAQSVGPIVLGLGTHLSAPLLRVRWPDGVMQAELNVTADKTLNLVELSRKTGSCPILFTWNGNRFACLGDFAGAAGLGFLEAPGEYHTPDRDEALAIRADQLRAMGGTYRLSVVEPMDEVAYLDQLTLDVVDRPPGVEATPDERFAFGTTRPSGELIAWTKTWKPIAAFDHAGRDVLTLIQAADRRSVDQFARLGGWIGFTEDHALVLDFGDQLAQLKPGDEPVLCLTGWVEYPYSQTNYAAATAGVILKPPVLEQQLPDGGWQVIDPAAGHPAGLTRLMTLNLAGKLRPGPRCVLRLKSNMECYWDQAFVALKAPAARRSIRTTSLAVAAAQLRDRGYLRESTPDGLQPVLPDYDRVDPVPLARLQGELTRHGDVAKLLQADDDHLCVMGPGDEVQLEFNGRSVPPLEPGWTRSFVFRSVAYCKDADPFTATSDSVGPLPWKGMPAFPFPAGGDRPLDSAYLAYLRDYQTRPAGER